MKTAGAQMSVAAVPGTARQPLLSVRGVKTYYGNIIALKGVDMDVHEGEIVTLIGANGAGKSTLMMTIFGSPRAREGAITYAGRDITRLAPHEIARLSIAQSPEGRRIFPRMSVYENLQMGAAVNGFAHFNEDLERVCALFPFCRTTFTAESFAHCVGGPAIRMAWLNFKGASTGMLTGPGFETWPET